MQLAELLTMTLTDLYELRFDLMETIYEDSSLGEASMGEPEAEVNLRLVNEAIKSLGGSASNLLY